MSSEDFYVKTYETFQKKLLKEEGLLSEDGSQRQRAWHCDPLVLHAPGTCGGCDKYPDRQQARIARHVNFTGEYLPDRSSCPSEYFRPADIIHLWRGNRPIQEPADVEIVEDVPADDKTENVLEFSQIVSVLANVTANLRDLLNDSDTLSTIVSAKSSLANGEALVEILCSDLHPPLFIEPSVTESVIVSFTPNVHDIATEIDPPGYHGKIVAYIRPESVEDDAIVGKG